MLKYAIVDNNKVQNIIVCESTEVVEHIKHKHQHIEFVGDDNNTKDIQIGYLWDGSKFYEDPDILEQRKLVEQEYQEYLKSLPEEEMEKGS